MNGIGWAVKQLQDGARVRRAGWNGKGMWLALVRPSEALADANARATERQPVLPTSTNPALDDGGW